MASLEKVIADPSQIHTFIPQKEPMIMIGNLVAVAGKKTVTTFLIPEDNIFVLDGLFREPGLIENMAQTAAAGVGYLAKMEKKDPPVGFIGGIRNLNIFSLPPAGSEIRTEVVVEHEVFDATIVNGKIFLHEVLIAEGELKIFLLKS